MIEPLETFPHADRDLLRYAKAPMPDGGKKCFSEERVQQHVTTYAKQAGVNYVHMTDSYQQNMMVI